MNAPKPDRMKLVLQEHGNTCGIACAAMISGVSYREACGRLAPPPSSTELCAAFLQRQLAFLKEKGWWPAAQIVLRTVISLEQLDSEIENDVPFKMAVEASQRILFVLAFADGSEPDHSVIWDRDFKDVVFDPGRGIIPVSELFAPSGLQSYSGIRGFTSFCYQPGVPIRTLIKAEFGIPVVKDP